MNFTLTTYSTLDLLAFVAKHPTARLAPMATADPWTAPRSRDVDALFGRYPFLSEPVHLVVPDITFRRHLHRAQLRTSSHLSRPGALLRPLSTQAGTAAPTHQPEAMPAHQPDVAPAYHPNTTSAYQPDGTLTRPLGTTPACQLEEAPRGNLTLATVSPGFCLAQLVSELPLALLADLACSLAGLYRFAAAPTDSILDAKPLASLADMTEFLSSDPALYGSRRAREALALSIDRLGSPCEAAVYLLLCLPRRLGGHGFPKPEANAILQPSRCQGRTVSQRSYAPDLLWRKERLVVEYDSRAFHASPEKSAHDAQRRNDLESMGYKVVVITQAILSSPLLFEKAAEQIRKRLGLRSVRPSNAVLRKRSELRRLLLQPSPQSSFWR